MIVRQQLTLVLGLHLEVATAQSWPTGLSLEQGNRKVFYQKPIQRWCFEESKLGTWSEERHQYVGTFYLTTWRPGQVNTMYVPNINYELKNTMIY